MSEVTIEERLKRHADAFESLLALTPVKDWETDNTCEQWKRKKSSKADKRRAKRAKLNPSALVNAKIKLQELEQQQCIGGNDNTEVKVGIAFNELPTTKIAISIPLEGERISVDRLSPISNTSTIISQSQQSILSTDNASPVVKAASISSATTIQSISENDKQEEAKVEAADELPVIDKEALRERLRAKIHEFRMGRKAEDETGRLIRTRQELLDSRRRKLDRRKKRKEELRNREKSSCENVETTEAELALMRGSGSTTPLLEDFKRQMNSADMENGESGLAFGRVQFKQRNMGDNDDDDNANAIDSSLAAFLDARTWSKGAAKRRKYEDKIQRNSNNAIINRHLKHSGGPAPKSHDFQAMLHRAEKLHAKYSGLDETKRSLVENNAAWQRATLRAAGVSNSEIQAELPTTTSLAQMRLRNKRKERSKQRSAAEWKARIQEVEKSINAKQRTREENLQSHAGRVVGNSEKSRNPMRTKLRRPGFEGSFKSRSKDKNSKA